MKRIKGHRHCNCWLVYHFCVWREVRVPISNFTRDNMHTTSPIRVNYLVFLLIAVDKLERFTCMFSSL